MFYSVIFFFFFYFFAGRRGEIFGRFRRYGRRARRGVRMGRGWPGRAVVFLKRSVPKYIPGGLSRCICVSCVSPSVPAPLSPVRAVRAYCNVRRNIYANPAENGYDNVVCVIQRVSVRYPYAIRCPYNDIMRDRALCGEKFKRGKKQKKPRIFKAMEYNI